MNIAICSIAKGYANEVDSNADEIIFLARQECFTLVSYNNVLNDFA